MNRKNLLSKLKAIKGPLFSFTAFEDGVTCEYITGAGCGFLELLGWSDLENFANDSADEEWDDMGDDELVDWIDRLDSGEFSPIEKTSSEEK